MVSNVLAFKRRIPDLPTLHRHFKGRDMMLDIEKSELELIVNLKPRGRWIERVEILPNIFSRVETVRINRQDFAVGPVKFCEPLIDMGEGTGFVCVVFSLQEDRQDLISFYRVADITLVEKGGGYYTFEVEE